MRVVQSNKIDGIGRLARHDPHNIARFRAMQQGRKILFQQVVEHVAAGIAVLLYRLTSRLPARRKNMSREMTVVAVRMAERAAAVP